MCHVPSEPKKPEEKKSIHPKWGENPIFGPQNDDVVILWWGYLYNFFKNKYFSISLFRQVKGCVMYLVNHRNQKKNVYIVIKVPPPQNDAMSFCGPKMGFSPRFGGRGIFFLVSMVQKVHDTPLDLPKKQN